MYDASQWHEVRTLAELAAAPQSYPNGVCLRVGPQTSAQDLSALPGSEHLRCVTVLALDGDVRAAADAILRSPHLTGVQTVVLGDVWWGDYSANAPPYGWQEFALSEALDALAARAPFENLVCRGALPTYDDGEYGGALGFVMIADWWKGLRGLEFDTRELHDGFLEKIYEFPKLRSLRVASPLLTDASTEFLSNQAGAFDDMEEFECEGYLISTMGWEWVFDAPWLPEHQQSLYDARACAPEKTWEERFGDVRSLTQEPMDVRVFHVVADQLTKLRDEDSPRYFSEIVPHLASLERERWPRHIEFIFGGKRDVDRISAMSSILPFLTFDVCSADPSWSSAKWEYLYESDVLGVVRRIEAFNHLLTLEDGQAFHDAEALAGLEELSLTTQHDFPVEALTTWLSAPYLSNLEVLELRLTRGMSSAAILDMLGSAEHLTSLRSLTLDASAFKADTISALAQAPILSQIDHLELSGLDATGRALLLASPHLSEAARAKLA